mgnify:CR=1 FL=1
MKRGQLGYTIIEVMLFLGISGSLLGIAFAGFNGKRSTTEFNQAMQEIEFKINQTFEDAQNGLYQNLANVKCDLSGVNSSGVPGYPRVYLSGGSQAGGNQNCVFLGRVLVFGGEADRNVLRTYSIIGKRDVTKHETKDLLPTVADINVLGEKSTLAYGVRVLRTPNAPLGKRNTNAIGAVNGLDDTRQRPALFTLSSYYSVTDALNNMNNQANYNGLSGNFALGKTGVNFVPKILCFERSDGGQVAQIDIGDNGQGLVTKLTMDTCEALP